MGFHTKNVLLVKFYRKFRLSLRKDRFTKWLGLVKSLRILVVGLYSSTTYLSINELIH